MRKECKHFTPKKKKKSAEQKRPCNYGNEELKSYKAYTKQIAQ